MRVNQISGNRVSSKPLARRTLRKLYLWMTFGWTAGRGSRQMTFTLPTRQKFDAPKAFLEPGRSIPQPGKSGSSSPRRSRSHASVNAAAPLVAGDLVFLSASYGTGAALLQIDGASVKQLWDSDDALSNRPGPCTRLVTPASVPLRNCCRSASIATHPASYRGRHAPNSH
jgi:hypothetical protein